MHSRRIRYSGKQHCEAHQLIDKGLRYILHDLKILQANPKMLPMSFPQILLVFSGIEFLSALLYVKGSHSGKVSKYISEWMPEEYNREIGDTTMGTFLYDSLRSGLVHFGNVKEDIVVDHDAKAGRFHLIWTSYRGKERLFIHGNQFAAHFQESVEKLKKGIRSNTVNLTEMQKNAQKLKKELEKSKKRIPPDKPNITSTISEPENNFSYPRSLPETTEGTTYKGGI